MKLSSKFAAFLSVICMLLVLLTGCNENVQPEGTANSTATTTVAEQSYIPNDHPGLVAGIYVSCGAYDLEINSLAFSQKIEFFVLSEEPLPADMDVIIDTKMSYSMNFSDQTPKVLDKDSCPLYLYQTMQGIDWKQAAVLKQAAQDAWNAYRENQEDPELFDAYQRTNHAHSAYMDTYSEGYEAYLAEKHTPEYYFYFVQLFFSERPTDEISVVREVVLTDGDWSYTVNVGEVRFNPTLMGQPPGEGIENERFSTGSYPSRPWTSGLCLGINTVKFTAEEDLQITGIHFRGEGQPEIEKATVAITANNRTIETQWIPGAPLSIREGEQVTISVEYYDPASRDAEYVENRVLIVEYDLAEGSGYTAGCIYTIRWRDSLEVYLWAVLGMDTRSYFVDYLGVE